MIYLDLHTHTIVSGHAYSTLNENIAAAKQHGLKIYGISDHAPKMPGSTHLFYFRNLHVVPGAERRGTQHYGCGRSCGSR